MEVYPLDAMSDVPPYEQLRVQVASRAASGELPAGTRLPTVRALAAELHLAVNTVAKAYRALETDGVIATEGRRGTFVATTTDTTGASDAAASYAALARRQGLTREEALNLVERSW
jgi:DNA-binding transcriptional regulator YhcF (GntR family)